MDAVSKKREELGSVRARIRSARLGWTDPDSGERLTVDVRGSASFLHELEPLGFEILPEEREDPAPHHGSQPQDESSARVLPRLAPAAVKISDPLNSRLIFHAELSSRSRNEARNEGGREV